MRKPLTLGFDTSAAHCAAALLSGDELLASCHEDMEKGQAERLFPLIEEMLTRSGTSWNDLDLIGVGTGPGNFTGIRIAVAAARGLALSLRIPAIGIGTAEALAFGLPRPCRIVVRLRREQFLWQDFGDQPTAPAQATRDELPPGPAVAEPRFGIAEGIARTARLRSDQPQPRPAPIYLRPADAAPARDRGPVILP
ncbi:tRNA (adenosine(37)-N6)-threonylcarbamoyltransferase complex dimerization subunit type 1 TsaB [Paracoccus aerodenitrificans]|uniref:tRNA (adenosine(37)-N6)-threonylcarbamoyltransferase complex dimerization subunit type 1 TsaB n=1 Tax=Paracoccus aerodenitrificans TaxID=3017781 RepID=UPI0022EFDF92|nr:tRNA (adenosine(37)-N6)-threonylcarbamoyltransferase complex dimerization subunit type 1 TsaB [Paracoccus aerodenitrificans]WBU64232.1 tRNA (adenosine(37)-N6)-threonylcarbamoyltransferase complex dimerization subunit type 1 TsaB [Paracoccus aerodenitrificans]